jgi:hypothetical protein
LYYTTEIPKLVSRQFDDEVILASFETGLYFSLAGSAADIWLGLKAGATVDEIANAFAADAGPDGEIIRIEIAAFVEKLVGENIVASHAGVPERQPWSLQFGVAFSPPVLGRFDDLRDLLFLDPVHDVSEAGWPMRAEDADRGG